MKFTKSSCLDVMERRILLWNSSCIPALLLPSSALLRPVSLSSPGEDKKERKKEHAYYNASHLHHMIFLTETGLKPMYLETLILYFVRDRNQYHKGKCHYCSALLNESWDTQNKLLTINSE